MRCIVSDLLAKCDEDATVRARMESYQHWDALHKLMLDVKDAKVNSIRHKRRRGEGEEAEDGDVALPVSPLSPLAAGAARHALLRAASAFDPTRRAMRKALASWREQSSIQSAAWRCLAAMVHRVVEVIEAVAHAADSEGAVVGAAERAAEVGTLTRAPFYGNRTLIWSPPRYGHHPDTPALRWRPR